MEDEQERHPTAQQDPVDYCVQPVTVEQMAGAFDGPDSVEWLRGQRR